MTSEATTFELARFAAELQFEDIPARVRETATTLLLDCIACAAVGCRGEQATQIARFVRSLAPGEASTTVIGATPASLASAVMLNAYLITAVTMCEVHEATLSHVTPSVLPCALAIAERERHGGRALLTAFVAGVETAIRVGLGMDQTAFRAQGWHADGVLGPFGGAAAAGRLFGFDAARMARAFGLAGSQAAGTFAALGTPTVKFHQVHGALAGLMAAMLAREDFGAPDNFLEAKDGGLLRTYSGASHPARVLQDLGARWEIEDVTLRPWPTASMALSAITALHDLISAHALQASKIDRVHVAMSPKVFQQHGNLPNYEGKFQAMVSVHYGASALLHFGSLSLDQFEPDCYDDPRLRAFAAQRVVTSADPDLVGGQSRVRVDCHDGTSVTEVCKVALGAPGRPMSRTQVVSKFRAAAGANISSHEIDVIVESVLNLEQMENLDALMSALRLPSSTGGAALSG